MRYSGANKLAVILCLIFINLLNSGCSINSLLLPEAPAPAAIYDVKGEFIGSVSKENRLPVSLDNVSRYMQEAIVAIEDSRFYSHHGIDPVGIARALVRDIQAGRIVEGGSTITQQLAKNLYLSQNRSIWRKLKELVLTVQLERKYTKKEILGMYLNQIYFGQGAYGIEAASRTYFNKPARELGLAESAMLAGIPKAPSLYAPSQNLEAAKARQAVVLDRMAELGIIDPEQAKRAKEEYLQPAKAQANFQKAPYFVAEIVRSFEKNNAGGSEKLYSGGLSVYTTLDLKMQEAAEKAITGGLSGFNQQLEGALVAIDPRTGDIRAMVGGRDFSRSQYNRALAGIQPGSAFKPFLYAAAIDSRYTAGSTIKCEPVIFKRTGEPSYQPKDYQGGYHYRPFTLKEALYTSDNVVAVRLNDMLGPARTAAYARRMGIESPLDPVLSLPLGTSEVTPLEMARAFGVLANNGVKAETRSILEVRDRSGRPIESRRARLEPVLDGKTAHIVTDMLMAVLQPGGTAANIAGLTGRPAAGKTGTTENFRDVWFVGYTPELAAAVYIGYDDKSKSVSATGGQLAAPIWARFMEEALKGAPPSYFIMPDGLVRLKICPDDGLLAGPFNTKWIEAVFVRGTEPATFCHGQGFQNVIPPAPDQKDLEERRYPFYNEPALPYWRRFLDQYRGNFKYF